MATTTAKLVCPLIHLNGTSAESLKDALSTAYDRLSDVLDAMRNVAPNQRDYYPEPGRWERALEQHRRRCHTLHELRQEMEAEMDLIDEQKGNP